MHMLVTAKHIKEIRENAGLSQAAFAKSLGVSQACVAKWELGERNPKYAVLQKLSKLYERLTPVA